MTLSMQWWQSLIHNSTLKIFVRSSEYQLDINFYKNNLRIFSEGKHTGIIRIKHPKPYLNLRIRRGKNIFFKNVYLWNYKLWWSKSLPLSFFFVFYIIVAVVAVAVETEFTISKTITVQLGFIRYIRYNWSSYSTLDTTIVHTVH